MHVLQHCKTWKDKAVSSLQKRGVAGTIGYAVSICKSLFIRQWKHYFAWNPWNPWYNYLDQRFDRRFAVDTAGVAVIPEIHSDPRFSGYSPTPSDRFFQMLRQVDVDYTRFVFIDFGCGKGKAVMLAAELPFKQIIGIELSAELIAIAEKNVRNYRGKRRCTTIQLLCIDATDFEIPNERAIYYFWDPFEAELMEKVLQNIHRSFIDVPREIYIVCFMPSFRSVLDKSGFLTRMKQASWYSIYKASAISTP